MWYDQRLNLTVCCTNLCRVTVVRPKTTLTRLNRDQFKVHLLVKLLISL